MSKIKELTNENYSWNCLIFEEFGALNHDLLDGHLCFGLSDIANKINELIDVVNSLKEKE